MYINNCIYLFIKFASALGFSGLSLPGLEKCRHLLHMAARACPGAAECSKWPLGPAPEPQNARNGRSGLPRSLRTLGADTGPIQTFPGASATP